jgi:hypothetical protein
MSHFSVLVAARNEGELFRKLLPYYEYGCDAKLDEMVQPYLEFSINHKAADLRSDAKKIVDDVPEELQTEYQALFDQGNYTTIFQRWEGGALNPETGDWGHWHNPNAHWDWYEIGGRFAGLLRSQGGHESSVMTACDVDWETMRHIRAQDAGKSWDIWQSVIRRQTTVMQYLTMDHDSKRAVWDAIRTGWQGDWNNYHEAAWFDPQGETKDKHVAKIRARGLTWAFVDNDNKWHQQADMGWWGMWSDEQPAYDTEFRVFVASLQAYQLVYVVDCHI